MLSTPQNILLDFVLCGIMLVVAITLLGMGCFGFWQLLHGVL